jgi:hypothetical protein
MAWKTLYVTGRTGFDSELVNKLDRSGQDFLTGSFNSDGTYLFWVTDNFVLATLKKIVGGKTIFKFHMRFFLGIESFAAYNDKNTTRHRFSPEQEQVFRELN